MMKSFRILDSMTEIVAVAWKPSELDADLMSRAGYGGPLTQKEYVVLTALVGSPRTEHDPFAWSDWTMRAAHAILLDNFDAVEDGGSLNVQRMREAMTS